MRVSHTASNLTDFFSQRFEALFPYIGTLGFTVCLTPQFLLPVYLHTNVGPPTLPAAALPDPIPAPPTDLDECFFFNSLVVGLPHSSIFCQFRLFFVFKFVVVLLLVV